MNKIKRLSLFLLVMCLIFSVLFALSACGDEENPDDTNDRSSGTDTENDGGLENDGSITYTIYVIDQNGNPVEGVVLQVCQGDQCYAIRTPTDAEGCAKKTLSLTSSDPLSIQINEVPEGFVLPTEKSYFPQGENVAYVTITQEEIYTVNAIDFFNGKGPLEGIKVSLYNGDDELVESKLTDENGQASFTVVPLEGESYYAKIENEHQNPAFVLINPDTEGGRTIEFTSSKNKTITAEFSISNQNIEYSVSVSDKNGVASGVEVSLYNSSFELVGTKATDQDGLVKFSTPNGTYYAVASTATYSTFVEFAKNGLVSGEISITEDTKGATRNTAILAIGYNVEFSTEEGSKVWYYVPNAYEKIVRIEDGSAKLFYNGVGNKTEITLNCEQGEGEAFRLDGSASEQVSLFIGRPGSAETPYELEEANDYSADVHVDKNESIYYSFIATDDYTVEVSSETKYAYITVNSNPNKKAVSAGEAVVICISTRKDTNGVVTYPEADVSFTVSCEKKYVDYKVNAYVGNTLTQGVTLELYYAIEAGNYIPASTGTSSSTGAYTFAGMLERSCYYIKASYEGYETDRIYVAVGDVTEIDIHLSHERNGSEEYPFLLTDRETGEIKNLDLNISASSGLWYYSFIPMGYTITINNAYAKIEIRIDTNANGEITECTDENCDHENCDKFIVLEASNGKLTYTLPSAEDFSTSDARGMYICFTTSDSSSQEYTVEFTAPAN